MKGFKLLLLVMAICLASGVKAQFYDGPDDIYYYVEYKDGNIVENGKVFVFNFDGKKAAILSSAFGKRSVDYMGYVGGNTSISDVKNYLKNNPSYYEEKVESTEYELEYTSSNTYQCKSTETEGKRGQAYANFTFSSNRNTLEYVHHYWYTDPFVRLNGYYGWDDVKKTYRRVDKSFFKVGRSRTPSNTLHE